MKNKSLQWRATLLVSSLIAAICIIMNLLICYTNTFYMDSLDDYIMELGNDLELQLTQSGESLSLHVDISSVLDNYQRGFNAKSWAITLLLTITGGFLTYFIMGFFLRPLHHFTEEIEKVQIQNLARPLAVQNAASDIKRLADSFNAMSNRLSLAFQSQRRFIDNAAHELRTPLAIMQTKLELYQKNKNPSKQESIEFATALSDQVQNLSSLVKTLLEMSELHTAEMKDSVNLADVVDEVLCDLDSLAEKKQLTLSQSVLPVSIAGNDTLLSRLVFNLVENAIKYTPDGGSVHVSLERSGDAVFLRVKDSGTGIPQNLWEEIMKPFCRVDKSRSRAMGGAGLGLALVHDIVCLHHGKIQVEASSAAGTVMLVQLPIKP